MKKILPIVLVATINWSGTSLDYSVYQMRDSYSAIRARVS